MVLATAATVIASQAVISGAFSLTRQAVQLGYSPRMEIIHTSEEEIGQIYIPAVNWVLMFSTLGLVLGFRESTNLAAAYGIAVTTTMVITTVLAYRGGARDLGLEHAAPPSASPRSSWCSTAPSSAPTSSRSPTAAGSPWWWLASSIC